MTIINQTCHFCFKHVPCNKHMSGYIGQREVATKRETANQVLDYLTTKKELAALKPEDCGCNEAWCLICHPKSNIAVPPRLIEISKNDLNLILDLNKAIGGLEGTIEGLELSVEGYSIDSLKQILSLLVSIERRINNA